jgi:hypothetical protein
MALPNPEDSLLLIRCPSCGQRFKVGEDLRERTVECGGCEHRFRINDDVIVRSRKFYPGERHNSGLNRFQRVPLAGGGGGEVAGQDSIRYAKIPDPAVLEPASPQRIIAGIVGASGIVMMALLLMFGDDRGGILDGMGLSNRLLMGGFTAMLGIGMLVYANPRARIKALLVGGLMSAGMLTVPFFFGDGPIVSKDAVGKSEMPEGDGLTRDPAVANEEKLIASLRNKIGTGPLDSEIERLAKEQSGKRAVGIWLRGMSESNRYLVRDYIMRVTRADPSSHFYPRDDGDYLMVVTGVRCSLQEMGKFTGPLGNTEKVYPELSIIEVKVRNENFVEGSIDKLSNKEDPAFYDLNKRELESIDLPRVERAVQRLAEAEPKLYRADITRKLIELLGDSSVTFKANICKALAVWSETPGPAGDAALAEVRRRVASDQEIQPEMLALLVKEGRTEVVPIIDELWSKNPTSWEAIYAEVGPPAESTLIQRFRQTEGIIRHSAVRILGQVGGADSLPVLKTAEAGADAELKVLLSQAEKSIQSRIGE